VWIPRQLVAFLGFLLPARTPELAVEPPGKVGCHVRAGRWYPGVHTASRRKGQVAQACGVWRRAVALAATLPVPLARLPAADALGLATYAQAARAPIPVGELPDYPQAVAVDPVTGTVFAADYGTGTVQVRSESTQTAAIPGSRVWCKRHHPSGASS
jgi:hypothetical protein